MALVFCRGSAWAQAAVLSQPVPPSPRLRALQTTRDSWLEPLSCPRTSLPLPHRLLLQDAEGEAEGSQQPSHPCPPSGVWSQTQKSGFCSLMPPKPLPSLSEAVVEATASLSCRVRHNEVILWLCLAFRSAGRIDFLDGCFLKSFRLRSHFSCRNQLAGNS